MKDKQLPKGSNLHSVHELFIVDTFEGARIPGMFTLLPCKNVDSILNKHTFTSLAKLEHKGRSNEQNGERITLFEM